MSKLDGNLVFFSVLGVAENRSNFRFSRSCKVAVILSSMGDNKALNLGSVFWAFS